MAGFVLPGPYSRAVADTDQGKIARLQAVLTALLQHQLGQSLERVEASLERWRRGELGPFEAHAEVLKHAARSERMASRIAQASRDEARSALRDALDAGLIERDEFIELAGVSPEEVEPSRGLDGPAPPKPDVVRELLERGPILVHVDARAEDVAVPLRLKRDPKLVLRFGYGLSPAIPDLTVDDQSLSGTLTFGGVPHLCVLPWTAIYAVVSEADQQGMVWPQDVPAVVLEEMASDSPLPGSGKAEARRPGAPQTTQSQPSTSPKPRASHLKLVE